MIFEKKIDEVAGDLAKRAGYDQVPWFMLTWWVLWIYTGLTMLVMFFKPDFLNITICCIGLNMMFNIDYITKLRFRMLVFGIFLSLLYDLFWFFYSDSYFKNDGSVESSVRQFSMLMATLTFFFKVSKVT